jgi:hypothetical protein
MEMRPIIQASALKLSPIRSYSALNAREEAQRLVTILPSIDGPMWQMT